MHGARYCRGRFRPLVPAWSCSRGGATESSSSSSSSTCRSGAGIAFVAGTALGSCFGAAAAYQTLRNGLPLNGGKMTLGAEIEAGADASTKETDVHAVNAKKLERFDKKIQKLQKQSQERVLWRAVDKEMLGMAPRLWMEVLDKEHRYASMLEQYWRRWQLSDTRIDFFVWLEKGPGCLIDLPQAPRRLLEEWRVIYLTGDQQGLFRARIEPSTGRFLWEADDTPVTIPAYPSEEDPKTLPTPRELAVAAIIEQLLAKTKRRDKLLQEARAEAERALSRGEEPNDARIAKLAEPLVKEGLLCQLRDPFFAERLDAAATPDGHAHFRALPRLPLTTLPGLSWEKVLAAIQHDELRGMSVSSRSRKMDKGIFVRDSFGVLYVASKLRGSFHHSSFVRGHCVKVAGGITIVDGWLQEMSPHSGHYQPSTELVEEMKKDWKASGVDFANVKIVPFLKP